MIEPESQAVRLERPGVNDHSACERMLANVSVRLIEELERDRQCVASTYVTWLTNVMFGVPSREQVLMEAGMMP
jgi:hypothetical protein